MKPLKYWKRDLKFLGIYSKNKKKLIHKDTCSSMFIAALFNCLQLIPSGWSTRSSQKSPAHLFVRFSFMVLPRVYLPLGRACTSSSFLQDPAILTILYMTGIIVLYYCYWYFHLQSQMKCDSSYFLNWWTLWWQNSRFQWWTPRTLMQGSTNFAVAVKKPAPSASMLFFPSNANLSSLSLEALNMPFILCMLKIQKAVSTCQFFFMVSSLSQFSLEAFFSSSKFYSLLLAHHFLDSLLFWSRFLLTPWLTV